MLLRLSASEVRYYFSRYCRALPPFSELDSPQVQLVRAGDKNCQTSRDVLIAAIQMYELNIPFETLQVECLEAGSWPNEQETGQKKKFFSEGSLAETL